MAVWDAYVPESERRIYERAGYGVGQPFGARPALLVVDVVESFTGSRPQDVRAAQEEYRTACGTAAWEALPRIRQLLDACRTAGLAVVFTKGDPVLKERCGGSTKAGAPGEARRLHTTGIPDLIAPREDEFVLEKTKASAFFASPLSVFLTQRGVDCLLVCGATTSGCVRATVVDAFSHGYRVFVVADCCFDRSAFSHAVSLFDLHQKYADVISLEEALEHVRRIARVA